MAGNTAKHLNFLPRKTFQPAKDDILSDCITGCKRFSHYEISLHSLHVRILRRARQVKGFWIHLGLAKQTPGQGSPATKRSWVIALPRIGGLHHRYERAGITSEAENVGLPVSLCGDKFLNPFAVFHFPGVDISFGVYSNPVNKMELTRITPVASE